MIIMMLTYACVFVVFVLFYVYGSDSCVVFIVMMITVTIPMLTLILVMVRRCNSILSMSSIMNHDTDASTRKHLNYNLSELRRVSQTPSLALIITVPNKGDPEKRDPENGSLFQVRLTGDLQVICFVGSPPSDPTSGYGDMFLLTPRSLFGPDGMLWRLEALDCRELIPAET